MYRTLLSTLLLATAPAWTAETDIKPLTPAQIAESATASIVLIRVPGGIGTGFVVADEGRIATNLHVVRGAGEATIITASGKEYHDVEVIAFDEARDLAVLRVPAQELKPLRLGNSGTVKAGERVVAIGHPLGLGNTVSDGLVSAVREVSPELTVLQISAPISPGSSGGPLFNDRGEVIGISTLVATRGQNLNFGIPVDALKPMLTSTRGTPIAKFAAKTGRQRNVPQHPLSLLENCPAPQLRSIVERIGDAIDIGAPLYNDGNFEACYRIYAATALEADQSIAECAGPRRALLDGLANADKVTSWDDKAWAMRDAFDGVLDVVERQFAADNSDNATTNRAASGRKVPHHPKDFLADCNTEDLNRIRDGIAAAIDSGAPLYNDGSVEACYRIYEGAIRDIDRKITACPAARNALHDGLREAEKRPGWVDKAWALRDSFDGLLEAIERK
jgi:serine protease Do